MDNGLELRSSQFSATKRRHKGGTALGLGNRRSIRLSYGANGSFPRFPPVKGQPATRQSRRKGLRMSAQEVAQPVPLLSDGTPDHMHGFNPGPINWPQPPSGHLVYFVGGAMGPVKIGFTQQPLKERLKCIQNGSPVKLLVLAILPAVRRKEAWYHRRFAKYRLHGEWFERVPEIMAEIERLNA